ncbi:MAG: sugar ABC transporter ATP-binding protein [Rhodoglobus sp.]
MTSTPLLVAKDLSISFGGIKALRGVDLEIGRGEILCLAGENGSGKSTFTKIVSGVYTPDSGEIIFDGEPVTWNRPRDAGAAGIQVIYQDLSLFEHLSVAENIAINHMMHSGYPIVSRRKMRRIASEQLERIGIDLPLDAPLSTLSMANRQIVAICRALSMDARLLFMDEPTTALTGREVSRLLKIVLELKRRGLSIVFISHKLDEVFKVADSITIFRDGEKVGSFPADELDELSLSRYMTGRDVTYQRYHREQVVEEPVIAVSNLTRHGHYEDVSFSVRPGDIVGLTGLLGSGRTEIALSLFGLNRPDSGSISINGTPVTIKAPWEAMEHGIALLPEDRQTQGLFGNQSVAVNASATMLDRILGTARTLSRPKEDALASRVVQQMGVNNKNTQTLVSNLSGGNQQKVVIGKWLFRNPAVFILDSPTIGIDIGSKAEIYDQIHKLAKDGMAVIFISDEPEEIVANCNRVLVMHEGTMVETFSEADVAKPGFKDELIRIISDPEADVESSVTTIGEAQK